MQFHELWLKIPLLGNIWYIYYFLTCANLCYVKAFIIPYTNAHIPEKIVMCHNKKHMVCNNGAIQVLTLQKRISIKSSVMGCHRLNDVLREI